MDQLRANIDVYQIDEEKTPFYENKDKSSMSAHWSGLGNQETVTGSMSTQEV